LYLTGPKSRKLSGQLVGLFIAIVVGIGLLWWQKDRLTIGPFSRSYANFRTNTLNLTSSGQADQVALVHSVAITPESQAFTADFYSSEEAHIPASLWQGINGRTDVEIYTVKAGDTLWGIANRYGLDIDTLRWSNPDLERNPDLLTPGSELVILPILGAYHTVAAGETLESIAAQYGVSDVDIINYPLNRLSLPFHLQSGQGLVIPNARKDLTLSPPDFDPGYTFAWPLSGQITQGYHRGHLAIDIGAPYGSSVYTADAGTVVYAKWARTGYGFTIVIEHDADRETLYSHLKGTFVQLGDQVERGQIIGEVGSTGNSTGPHVHFEIREQGKRVNPLDYLK